ncbi:MAG: arginine deiminase-related protein, partial [Saprospiraceae bacterium]
MSALSTHLILMIRPYQFGFNPETAESNAFQQQDDQSGAKDIASRAQQEFDQMVARLTEAGVQVLVVEDTPSPLKPDAVFPNNWITLHDDGKIITYP